MATKGASNRYGRSRGSRSNGSTGFEWARDFNKKTLKDHFNRHGKDMGCDSEESYRSKAVNFANYIDKKNCETFVDKHGSTYKYNKATNTFAIITKDGYVVTYYKPKRGHKYYKDEKRSKKK